MNGDFILVVCMIFMVIAGLNFALHYYAFSHITLRHYFRDTEAKVYLILLAVRGMIVVAITLLIWNTHPFNGAIRQGFFHTISIMTTTGFTTDNFSVWPQHIAFVLIILSFFGACAGSTGGWYQNWPNGYSGQADPAGNISPDSPQCGFPHKNGQQSRVNPRIADAIWGFFGAYLIIYYVMVVILPGYRARLRHRLVGSCRHTK
ncbi:MAG: potassium transporter TrkG [Porticoccaceae bacterium]